MNNKILIIMCGGRPCFATYSREIANDKVQQLMKKNPDAEYTLSVTEVIQVDKVYLIIQTTNTTFAHTVFPMYAYTSEDKAAERVFAENTSLAKPKEVSYSYFEIEVI